MVGHSPLGIVGDADLESVADIRPRDIHDIGHRKRAPEVSPGPYVGSGGWIRTSDLQVMSLTVL